METLKDGETPWRTRSEMASAIKARLRQMASRKRIPQFEAIRARKPAIEVRELEGAAGELGLRAYTVKRSKTVAGDSANVPPTMAVSLSYLSIQGRE